MNLESSILATIAYHDIFDYPLTLEEVHTYLIGKQASIQEVHGYLCSKRGAKKVGLKNNFYFLKGRGQTCQTRKQREKYSREKFKKAENYTRILKLIPTLKLLAVSGALAMQNSHIKDDIDFVLVAQSGAIWTTRFCANLLMFPFKRRPNSKNVSNKVCLNLFLDQSGLKIKTPNIYQAHELCQMKILYDKEETYSKLIKSNLWVYKFLPNWHPEFSQNTDKKSANFPTPKILESVLKNTQLAYMKKKVTTEKIGERQLFFHPADTENHVLAEFKKRLIRLKISSSY